MTEQTQTALPLPRERAAEIVANVKGRLTGPEYRAQMTGAEIKAVNLYWMDHAPGSWSFNDVVRACAK